MTKENMIDDTLIPSNNSDGEKCIFYPNMDCSVLDAIGKKSMEQKLTPIKSDNVLPGISIFPKELQRYGVLAPFCGMCANKGQKEFESMIAFKMTLAKKYGSDYDATLHIVRVFDGRPVVDEQRK